MAFSVDFCLSWHLPVSLTCDIDTSIIVKHTRTGSLLCSTCEANFYFSTVGKRNVTDCETDLWANSKAAADAKKAKEEKEKADKAAAEKAAADAKVVILATMRQCLCVTSVAPEMESDIVKPQTLGSISLSGVTL